MSKTKDCLHYVYILQCVDNLFYTGMTSNVERRVHSHNNFEGRPNRRKAWTSFKRPLTLVFSHEVCCRDCALKSEKQIKNKSRESKLKLIEHPESFIPYRCERYPTLKRLS